MSNVLPILAYGHPILRKKAQPITPDYPGLATLIDDIWETMYAAEGIGLAAPQIGLAIRLFVIDSHQFLKDGSIKTTERNFEPIKQVFINPVEEYQEGEPWAYKEGCLSIPEVKEYVLRKSILKINYLDADFKPQQLKATGLTARVIQHEYDHLEGILFTDRLQPLKKRLIKRKLNGIKQKKIQPDYPMTFLHN